MKTIKRLFAEHREVVMYLIFGVATTLVNWVVTFLLQKVFGLAAYGWQFVLTNAIAWVAAVLFAFFTNKKYVFESKTTGKTAFFAELVKFVGARLATGAIEITLPTMLVSAGLNQSLFSFKGFWAKAVTSVIVIVLNYVFSKLFVFRKKNLLAAEGGEGLSAEEDSQPSEASEE
ncbi:MAG: GtrA family protein [Lachnospiraceae bacterium]|nr:GtrA family protein [Lachnospiraceae bacterium]